MYHLVKWLKTTDLGLRYTIVILVAMTVLKFTSKSENWNLPNRCAYSQVSISSGLFVFLFFH